MSNKPTIPELNKCLSDLVKWQEFALYLPGIDHTAIKIIKENERDDVVEQKIALYDKWLQVYPNASWDDVIKALQTSGENSIAKQLREKYIVTTEAKPHTETEIKQKTNPYPFDAVSMSPSGQSQPQEVTVSEDIVSELDALQRSFVDLTGHVKSGVEKQLENCIAESNIKSLTRNLQEERAFPIPSLRSVTTSDELFDAIHPHYNFLNCYLIVSVALYLSGAIAEKATEYKEKVRKFMKTTKIQSLQNTLKRYSRTREYSNTRLVEIVVENGWEVQNLWLVRNLVTALFPMKHPDELPWYDIVPGSVVMTFIALKHMTSSLIENSRKKAEFMRLIGVISLKVEDEFVWKRTDEDRFVLKRTGEEKRNPFSFEDSLIQATLADNIEVVQFLLQYTQVNVNTKNTSNVNINTLVNVGDESIYWNQRKVEEIIQRCYTTFTVLLKNVEYEFQYVQQQTMAVDDDSNDSSPFNSGDSKSTHCPRDNFLSGRVLAGLSNQLPEPLSTRVKQYQATIDGVLKRKAFLIYLRSSLEKYFPIPFPNSIEVVLTLHNVWRACSVWYVEQLGQLIFSPTLFHKLQWFRVDTMESLKVVLLADKELMDSFTKESLGSNALLTSLFGVISVQVDDTVVISNDYSNGYTFSKAMELAKAKGNDDISDLLLRIQQSPVDFIRFRKPDGNNNSLFLPQPDSTPLMIACCNNNSQLVQLLLDHNADPNVQNREGYAALTYSTGNSKIFQMLLDHKADIETCAFFNETVLHYACRAGNIKVVKTILAVNCNLVHMTTSSGRTSLMEAIRSDQSTEQIVEMLLQAKADPNIQDNQGWTALQLASRNNHIELVKMFLQAKVDPNIQNTEGWTALKSASRYGHTEIVGMLLQAKADPNVQDNEGWTALKSAADYGHTEIVSVLLQAKANPDIQDNDGWTALHQASRCGHTEIVRILLQSKANPNLVDKYGGLTALDLARKYDKKNISEQLSSVRIII